MKNLRLYICVAILVLGMQSSAFSKEKKIRPLCTRGACDTVLYVFPHLKSEKRYILWPANANFLEKIHVYKDIAEEVNPKKSKK